MTSESKIPAPAPAHKARPSRSIASYLLGLIGRSHATGHMGTTNTEAASGDASEVPAPGGDSAASEDLRHRRGEAFGTDRHHPAT